MRTIGRYRMEIEGMRFGLNEWTGAAFGAAMSIMLWFVIGYANALAIRKLGLHRLRYFLLVASDIIVALIVIKLGSPVWAGLPGLLGEMVFPKGIFVIGAAFTISAIWKVWRLHGQPDHLAEGVLGIYAVLVGMRVMMEMFPTSGGLAVFFNGPVFIVFVIVVARVVASGGQSLDEQRRHLLVGCMLCTEALLLIIVLFPPRELLSALLFPPREVLNAQMKTEFGTIYTQADRAVLFPQIISFMKTHAHTGKDILVVPEAPSLYFFSGLQSPSRWYGVQPGVLDPKQELTFIKEADSAHVQYVLICNRPVDEFGIAPFGIGYDQSIYKWILANYIKISQFGPRADLLPSDTNFEGYEPFVMEVYKKKAENKEVGS